MVIRRDERVRQEIDTKCHSDSCHASWPLTRSFLSATWDSEKCVTYDLQWTTGLSPASISPFQPPPWACGCHRQRGTRLNNWAVNRRFMKRLAARTLRGARCSKQISRNCERKQQTHPYLLSHQRAVRWGRQRASGPLSAWMNSQVKKLECAPNILLWQTKTKKSLSEL